MAKTIQALARECGVTYQRLYRYIEKEGLKEQIDTSSKPFKIPDELAEQIANYFAEDEVASEDEAKEETDALIEQYEQRLSEKDRYIELLAQQIEDLREEKKELSDLNKGLYMQNAAMTAKLLSAYTPQETDEVIEVTQEQKESEETQEEEKGFFQRFFSKLFG